MHRPFGLLQFPLLLEGIFHPLHCNLQTLHSCQSSRLALARWFHGSITNGAQKISIIASSIPLVPLQALHGCTHWLCFLGSYSSRKIASATVLWIPFICIISGAYSSKSNRQQYNLSEVSLRAPLEHFIHVKAVGLRWHASFIVAMPMVRKRFPFLCAQFLWFHTKHSLGVLIGCVELRIIF